MEQSAVAGIVYIRETIRKDAYMVETECFTMPMLERRDGSALASLIILCVYDLSKLHSKETYLYVRFQSVILSIELLQVFPMIPKERAV